MQGLVHDRHPDFNKDVPTATVKHNPEKANNTKDTKIKLVWFSCLMTIGQETWWAYSTMLPNPRGACSRRLPEYQCVCVFYFSVSSGCWWRSGRSIVTNRTRTVRGGSTCCQCGELLLGKPIHSLCDSDWLAVFLVNWPFTRPRSSLVLV